MSTLSRLPPRDLEELSSYLDGQLEPRARAQFEARLEHDEALQRAAREMRATIELVRTLPQVPSPRRFTLTPEMAGLKPRRLAYPALRLATAVATLGFLVTVGVDAFTRTTQLAASRATPAAAPLQAPQVMGEAQASPSPAPVESFGLLAATPTPEVQEKTVIGLGGGVATQAEMPAPTQSEPLLRSAAPPAPAATPALLPCADCTPTSIPTEVAVADQAQQNALAATQEVEQTAVPPAAATTVSGAVEPLGPVVLRLAEVSLAALALLLGGLTIWLRRRAR